MKWSFKDLLFYLILGIFLLLLDGCSKQIEYRYVYIKPNLPYLITYDYNKSLKLHLYNKGNNVCVVEWNNSCIPKEKFKELYLYTHNLKANLQKCNLEIKEYQKFYQKYNQIKGQTNGK